MIKDFFVGENLSKKIENICSGELCNKKIASDFSHEVKTRAKKYLHRKQKPNDIILKTYYS